MPGLWFNPNPVALSSLLEVRLVEVVHYFLSVQRRMKETEKLKIEMEMFLVRIKLNPRKLGRKCFKLYWGGGSTISPKHFCLFLQLLLYLIQFMELQEVFSKLSVSFLFCTVFTCYMLVPGMPTLECQSVGRSGQSNSLVWTEIHQLFDGLPWNVLQAYRVFLDNAFYIRDLWGLLHTHVLARLDSVWLVTGICISLTAGIRARRCVFNWLLIVPLSAIEE